MVENIEIKRIARDLRKNQTEAEKIFWELVRDRKLFGFKFLRQHPIEYQVDNKVHYFFADFYCAEKKMIIELDGKIHDFQRDYDEARTRVLDSLGLSVIRVKNDELFNRTEIVKKLKLILL